MLLWICGIMLLFFGAVMAVLPIHMGMTGLVLLLLGGAMVLSAVLLRKPTEKKETFVALLTLLASAAVIILMACMNLVTTGGEPDWDNAEKSDYAIVLGASIHENGQPSRILRSRLQAAMEFMERNPNAVVILSGGQGPDEPQAEALSMFRAMVEMGADPERLLQEDKSVNTRENLLYSMEIMEARGGTEVPVTLITSEFHQRRADYIASTLNIDTCPVSAHTDLWFYRVNYTLREVFAFVKAAFQGIE